LISLFFSPTSGCSSLSFLFYFLTFTFSMLIADLPGACSLGEQVKHVWELEEVASAVLGAEAMVARDMVRYQADLEAT
jgi:hypothetical protein